MRLLKRHTSQCEKLLIFLDHIFLGRCRWNWGEGLRKMMQICFGIMQLPLIYCDHVLFVLLDISNLFFLRGGKSAVLYRFVSALCMRCLRVLLKFLGLKCKVLYFFSCIFKKLRRTCTERRGGWRITVTLPKPSTPRKFSHANMMAWKMHFLFKYGYSEYLCYISRGVASPLELLHMNTRLWVKESTPNESKQQP